MNNEHIYKSKLKPYQIKKLFLFRKSGFLTLYKSEDKTLTQLQYEYKLCTHLSLLRFNDKDIVTVMSMWYKRHGVKANWARLRKEVMPRTRLFTKKTIQDRRHEEYLRRVEKQKGGSVGLA